ncbi:MULTISPECIES: hypothetical protein [unclassified Rathayibacter]|jgi:hypothetical protein|uniref:hypothetical protein n=2 Tax=unclassified Rathayibacter TaxID=2609250 RepID=UPI0011B04D4A|nr:MULTISPECIES: hypothetical protein [unclassified Rathayibacter]
MKSEPGLSDRDHELRRMLVATPTATPVRAPRSRRTLAVSVTAFVAAGILSGAVSAAALESDAPDSTVNIAEVTQALTEGDATFYGTPVVINGQGRTEVQLGPAPDPSAKIATAFVCVDRGRFDLEVDGEAKPGINCDGDTRSTTNGGAFLPVFGDGEHTITVVADGRTRYTFWASWIKPAEDPEPSAALTEALADGVVTESEYRDGFARYRACMEDAGLKLFRVDESGPIISYSNLTDNIDSGDEKRCYDGEFGQLDAEWQVGING